MTLREIGLRAYDRELEELGRKLDEAEAEWLRCDGSVGIDRLQAAFHNRVYLKRAFDKMQQDRDRFANPR